MAAGSPLTLNCTAPQKQLPLYVFMVRQSPVRSASALNRNPAVLDPNTMDALSDVLKSVRLAGACYLNAEFTAPWCIRGELGIPSVRERLAGADHVSFFHFLTEG